MSDQYGQPVQWPPQQYPQHPPNRQLPDGQPQWGQQYEQPPQTPSVFPPLPYNAPPQQYQQPSPYGHPQWNQQVLPQHERFHQTQHAWPPIQDSTSPQYYRAVPKETPTNKQIIWGIVVVVLIVLFVIVSGAIIAGASSKDSSTPSTSASTVVSSNSDVSSDTSTPTPIRTPTQATPSKVGETITVNGVRCTLVSLHTLQADEFNTPKAGNEYIVVRVKLVNNSDSEVDYNPYDFHIKSGSGNITDHDYASLQAYTANNILDSGTLSQSGSVVGDIIFQVPIGDHKAELTWQPNILGNAGENVWSLGL